MTRRPEPKHCFTVTPFASTSLPLTVLPDARCTIEWKRGRKRFQGSPHSHISDEEGNLILQVSANVSEGYEENLVLSCTTDHIERRVPLSLRVGTRPTQEFPFPPVPKLRTSSVRRRLTRTEALLISHSELREMGYPTRPKVESGPSFERWLRQVTRPTPILRQETVENPNKRANFNTTQTAMDNWCGFVLETSGGAAGGTYSSVHGQWETPSLLSTSGVGGPPIGLEVKPKDPLTELCVWVGVDGYGTANNVLWQAGIELDVTALLPIWRPRTYSFVGYLMFTNVYGWSEFLPAQQQVVWLPSQNLINAGDWIVAEVGFQPNSTSQRDLYYSIENFGSASPNAGGSTRWTTGTQNWTSPTTYTNSKNAVVPCPTLSGTTAEWILENTTNADPTLGPLTNFSTFQMCDVIAKTASGDVSFAGDTNNVSTQITLQSLTAAYLNPTNNTLAVASPAVVDLLGSLDSDAISFSWVAYQ
jgi:Peptidase A4 family